MRSDDFVGDPASSRAFPGWETVTVDGKDYLVPPEDVRAYRPDRRTGAEYRLLRRRVLVLYAEIRDAQEHRRRNAPLWLENVRKAAGLG